MELQIYQPTETVEILPFSTYTSSPIRLNKTPIIEANTIDVKLLHLKTDCTIPVFAKDNERTISHQEFIQCAMEAIEAVFGRNTYLQPEIRVSHTIKGRTPDAIHKSANELMDHEKTIYYERMAFAIELQGFTKEIGGNELCLTIGGVRAYNQENLYNKKSLEHFKFFIGFKNMVCCNMCVSSDGFVDDLRVGTVYDLKNRMIQIIRNYKMEEHIEAMDRLTHLSINEQQFAQILGKCRLYQFLPKEKKRNIPALIFNDTQVNTVAKDYFLDESFARNANGDIDLWKMYNLFTGANKSSYIDLFLQRGLNAFELAEGIGEALVDEHSDFRWFIE
jgi:hypothetical protein